MMKIPARPLVPARSRVLALADSPNFVAKIEAEAVGYRPLSRTGVDVDA
jgi:hypothetical protein